MADWLEVKSSNLKAVQYEPALRTLNVRFFNGREYAYKGVSQSMYDKLMKADSKGEFFHDKIRPLGGKEIEK